METDDDVSEDFIDRVCDQLSAGKAARHRLPGGGWLSIDRLLPFLCVYRHDPQFEDPGTRDFADHEAAYLSAPGNSRRRPGLHELVRRIVQLAVGQYGAFLVLEIRAAPDSMVIPEQDPRTGEQLLPAPGFTIHADPHLYPPETLNTLYFGLQKVRLNHRAAKVTVALDGATHPPGLVPIPDPASRKELNCHVVGLEILPVYREGSQLLPKVLQELRRRTAHVLKKAFFEFAVNHTSLRPADYYALGRSHLSPAVWETDHALNEVGRRVDLLLLATPINAEAAWLTFRDSGYQTLPRLLTRPLPFDPFVTKRDLLHVKVEKVSDPTVSRLFTEYRNDVDRQLTMLADIDTSRFLHGSIQVFGAVETELRQLAEEIIRLTGVVARQTRTDDPARVTAERFAEAARACIRRYQQQDETFEASVEIRDDLFSGLLVSGTRLLIGRGCSMAPGRVEALLAHEVGTHLVTRHNGRQQPMTLLQSGLAGYDALQEGIAVLAEFLAGGLTLDRLRLLAVRVTATDEMVRGAPFKTVFEMLCEQLQVDPAAAFTITMRVFRGGGLTKDAAYLRGLQQVLQYLHKNGDETVLFTGKMAACHIPLVRELLSRGVLKQPAVLPDYLTSDFGRARLQQARLWNSVTDMAAALSAEQPPTAQNS